MSTDWIRLSEENGIARLTLDRPDKRNALHGPMIAALSKALQQLAASSARVLLIHGEGEHFCAGADIGWMQKVATLSADENYDDAEALADLLYQLHVFPKPTVVLAHGATLGGGLGLLTAADIAIAAPNAVFGLPEVKMGLVPSVISPYVIAAIGQRQAHYYFLTGEKFGAEKAADLGLIHQVTESDTLMRSVCYHFCQRFDASFFCCRETHQD